MGTIPEMVPHRMESFREKQMRLDGLLPLGWREAADLCRERGMKYGTAQWMIPAVGKPQSDMTEATPSPTTFGELMQNLHIV